MIVTSSEIFFRAERHVAGGHRNVGVPGQIVCGIISRWYEFPRTLICGYPIPSATAVIHSVITTITERESADCTPGMVGDILHIRRKERLVEFVYMGRDVRPPKECLG